MKALPFLFLAALCATASAQRKLWTWESPLKDDLNYGGNINGAAVDSRGYSAFLIGESSTDVRRHRVLWMSPKGAVLHEETFDRPDELFHLIVDGFDLWKILHVSASALSFTDGERIWTIKLKGKTKSREVALLESGTSAFTTIEGAPFPGWVQQTGEVLLEFSAVGRTFKFQTPKSISLWSIK